MTDDDMFEKYIESCNNYHRSEKDESFKTNFNSTICRDARKNINLFTLYVCKLNALKRKAVCIKKEDGERKSEWSKVTFHLSDIDWIICVILLSLFDINKDLINDISKSTPCNELKLTKYERILLYLIGYYILKKNNLDLKEAEQFILTDDQMAIQSLNQLIAVVELLPDDIKAEEYQRINTKLIRKKNKLKKELKKIYGLQEDPETQREKDMIMFIKENMMREEDR